MNLIDFYVKEILEEKKDKVYKLYDMSEEALAYEEHDAWWHDFLLGDGVKQTYKYVDEGGEKTKTEVFNITKNQKPYYVGYVGQH